MKFTLSVNVALPGLPIEERIRIAAEAGYDGVDIYGILDGYDLGKAYEASLEFYEKLGCERAFVMDNEGEPWNYYLRICKGQYVELQPVKAPNPHPHPETCKYYEDQTVMHFSFETDDLAELISTLRSRGLTLYKNPEPDAPEVTSKDNANYSEDKCISCWVKDPDGNPIELMEQTQYSLQRLSEIRLSGESV